MKTILLFIAINLFIIGTPVIAQGMPPAFVHIVKAEQRELAPTAWTTGHIISRNDAQLSVEVSGRIKQLVDIGTQTQKGDIIAKIDDSPLMIERQEAKASVRKAEANLEFLQAEVKRKSQLSKQNLSALTDFEKTKSERDIAIGELAVNKARLARIEKDIEFSQLTAPFNGLVVERLASIGEYVTSGSSIVRLIESDHLEAAVYAPITSYQFVQRGDSIKVKSAIGTTEALIKDIVQAADNQSQLMEIRIDLSTLNWPAGLNIQAAIPTAAKMKTLAIPRDALILRRGMTQVFRVKPDNTAEMLMIETGIANEEWIQVIGDLQIGDQVVVRGGERLQPGQSVMIKPSNDNLISGQQ